MTVSPNLPTVIWSRLTCYTLDRGLFGLTPFAQLRCASSVKMEKNWAPLNQILELPLTQEFSIRPRRSWQSFILGNHNIQLRLYEVTPDGKFKCSTSGLVQHTSMLCRPVVTWKSPLLHSVGTSKSGQCL